MNLSLKNRFFLLVAALFIITMIAVTTISYVNSRNAIRDEVKARMIRESETLAAFLRTWIESRVTALKSWAGQEALVWSVKESFIDRASWKSAAGLLEKLKTDYEGFLDIHLFSPEGRIFVSTGGPRKDAEKKRLEKFWNDSLTSALKERRLISEIRRYPISDAPVFAVFSPVMDAENTIGILCGLIDARYVNQRFTASVKPGGTGYAYVTDSRNLVVIHPEPERILADDRFTSDAVSPAESGNGFRIFSYEGVERLECFSQISGTGWTLKLVTRTADLFSSISRIRNLSIMTAAIGLLVCLLMLHLLILSITTPINLLAETADRLSAGDIECEIPPRSARDEIGLLSDSFRSLIAYIQDAVSVSEKIARGDLSVRVKVRSDKDALGKSLTTTVANLRTTAEIAEKIAEGDLSVKMAMLSEDDMLGKALSGMANQIQNITAGITRMTAGAMSGDLGVRGDPSRFGGVFARIIEGGNALLEIIIAPMRQTAARLAEIATGEIPETVREEYQGDFNEISNNINILIHNLARFALDAQHTARLLAAGSESLSNDAEQLALGSTRQASNVEEISSSIEEMSATLSLNADNARETAAIAAEAAAKVKEGREAVDATLKAMKRITEEIMVIESIAGQTNMLALNAAIEAARAGEHGKGFAVVAGEVRTLARKTEEAARTISELSASNISLGEKNGLLLEEMMSGIEKTAELIQEISVSGSEQSHGIAEINRAIQGLDQTIQSNAAATGQAAAASREFRNRAEELLKIASFFRVPESEKKRVAAEKSAELMEKSAEPVEDNEQPVIHPQQMGGEDHRLRMRYISMEEEDKADVPDSKFPVNTA
ncbi:MAG: hypothetical protein CSB33_00110 [Desulfobacterales bacterium]|nr:MAG: hypothetical protein CSB33_00110 [Desulfobacterales bacterium]